MAELEAGHLGGGLAAGLLVRPPRQEAGEPSVRVSQRLQSGSAALLGLKRGCYRKCGVHETPGHFPIHTRCPGRTEAGSSPEEQGGPAVTLAVLG
jgi:hypothetical protein